MRRNQQPTKPNLSGPHPQEDQLLKKFDALEQQLIERHATTLQGLRAQVEFLQMELEHDLNDAAPVSKPGWILGTFVSSIGALQGT